MSESSSQLRAACEQLASSLWEDVDWFEEQEKVEASKPGAVGVPLSLIGEATTRMAQKIEAFAVRMRQEALREAAREIDSLLSQQTWAYAYKAVDWLRARADADPHLKAKKDKDDAGLLGSTDTDKS